VSALDDYLRERRAEVEAALDRYLTHRPDAPSVVVDAMRYSLMAGGKRLRPMLTLAAADAAATVNGSDPAAARALALPAACAIEMIHTYSLIHDDLPAMDDDVLRRGRPTLHVIAGDGMAILAGDGLHAEAFGLLAREPVSTQPLIAERKLRVITRIADAAGPAGMVGGQAIDLEAVRPGPGRKPEPLDAPGVEGMHMRKTGALIRASAVAGAIMAGAGDALIAAIDRYATQMGLAFQIVDDILDVEAASADLGKTAGKDAAAGKPTYPAVVGLEQSRAIAGDCLTRAEQALRDAHLSDSHLAGIARWVVTRRS
jgi:geranylgeranyl diphosphate synthase, type II